MQHFRLSNAYPSARARILERRTYLRPLNENGTAFETPAQMLDRVIGHQRWLWENAKGKTVTTRRQFGNKFTGETQWRTVEEFVPGTLTEDEEFELQELRAFMEAKMVSASGRVKWMGGTDVIKERAAAAFNCLGSETRFITSEGVKSFDECRDGQVVTVLTHRGRWRRAVVRSYGEQELHKITFSRGRSKQEVRATKDHRWVLDDGSETTTLGIGDRLTRPDSSFNDWSFENAPVDEKLYWAYGYVYGDGTLSTDGGRENIVSMVRLCGAKENEFLPRFEELGFKTSKPLSCGGDAFAYTGRYQKTLPDPKSDDPRLIRAFVAGYLDADGGKNTSYLKRGGNRFNTIQATRSEAQSFIRDVFPVAGVYISREETVAGQTNLGQRSNETLRFGIQSGFGKSSNSSFVVSSIELDAWEKVWCLEVEEDHSFTLANGIVTGNCSFTFVQTPADMVDVFWLLLQGTGVGFKPLPGLLTGFRSTLTEIEIVPSVRTEKGGAEDNVETYNAETRVWTLRIGDSAKAWAKAVGKLLAGKYPATKLVLDLSELRPGGKRLRGYGWLSSGWEPLAKALRAIAELLIRAADRVLSSIEIGDFVNWLGTVLSSRRSAQIWLMDDTSEEVAAFATAKIDRYMKGNAHREQSNNSILFWTKPARVTIVNLLRTILGAGEENSSGDPGFINAAEAKRRAPEFAGVNPCAEILLADKGFCNLFQVVWSRFNGNLEFLKRAQYIAGRANYRQTCVTMKDGVLQRAWDNNQHLLRLCGVSPTGYVAWDGADEPAMLEAVRDAAIAGADSMADELGMPRARRVTQVQPAGTSSKVLGLEGDEVHEGAHTADSRYIFNNVNFSRDEPLVQALRDAGYRVKDHPFDPTSVLVALPVAYPASPAFKEVVKTINGREEVLEIAHEPAVKQLERYRLLMKHYAQNNVSITVSYDETEIEEMADWFMANWDSYVGVSFLKRVDASLTAEDLGFSYLPQESVSRRMYEEYANSLLPVDLTSDNGMDMIDSLSGCATGACPVR